MSDASGISVESKIPDSFWDMLGSSDVSLKKRGINPKAAERWQICLNNGGIPDVNMNNEPFEYPSLEDFLKEIDPLVLRFQESDGLKSQRKCL